MNKVEFVLRWLLWHQHISASTCLSLISYRMSAGNDMLFDAFHDEFYPTEDEDWNLIANSCRRSLNKLIAMGIVIQSKGKYAFGASGYSIKAALFDDYKYMKIDPPLIVLIEEYYKYIGEKLSRDK